jgi:hypothetical protein
MPFGTKGTLTLIEVSLHFSLSYALRKYFERLNSHVLHHHYLPGINIAAFIPILSGYSKDLERGLEMRENVHINTTERVRPLTHYSQEMIEPTSSKFIEVHIRPVLMYSESPSWLEDLWSPLKDTLFIFDNGQPLLHPAKTRPQIDDILIIEIRKYTSSPPTNQISVGRDASNDIVFFHESISKVHAHIVETEPGELYKIIDANSTNGTRVNNLELPPFHNQTLINLDQIEFGKTVRAVYLTPRGLYELVQDLIRVGII